MLLEEKTSDTALPSEVIPTTPEVKENVAMAICCAAKNGNFAFFSLKHFYWSLCSDDTKSTDF